MPGKSNVDLHMQQFLNWFGKIELDRTLLSSVVPNSKMNTFSTVVTTERRYHLNNSYLSTAEKRHYVHSMGNSKVCVLEGQGRRV
jgi:hypothetical protein